MKYLTMIAAFAVRFAWPSLASLGAKFALSSLIPGGGIVMAAWEFFAAIFRQVYLSFRDVMLNPRVIIAIAIVACGFYWHGYKNGFAQGEGDLQTYRRSAEVLAVQSSKDADDAVAERLKAEAAEQALVRAEKLQAKRDDKEPEAAPRKPALRPAKARRQPVKADTGGTP